jgi:hypothetical protein
VLAFVYEPLGPIGNGGSRRAAGSGCYASEIPNLIFAIEQFTVPVWSRTGPGRFEPGDFGFKFGSKELSEN